MIELFYGNIKTKYAYVGQSKNKLTYYVAITNWQLRKGGGYRNLSLQNAVCIAKKFVAGAPAHFDSINGLQLDSI